MNPISLHIANISNPVRLKPKWYRTPLMMPFLCGFLIGTMFVIISSIIAGKIVGCH